MIHYRVYITSDEPLVELPDNYELLPGLYVAWRGGHTYLWYVSSEYRGGPPRYMIRSVYCRVHDLPTDTDMYTAHKVVHGHRSSFYFQPSLMPYTQLFGPYVYAQELLDDLRPLPVKRAQVKPKAGDTNRFSQIIGLGGNK